MNESLTHEQLAHKVRLFEEFLTQLEKGFRYNGEVSMSQFCNIIISYAKKIELFDF